MLERISIKKQKEKGKERKGKERKKKTDLGVGIVGVRACGELACGCVACGCRLVEKKKSKKKRAYFDGRSVRTCCVCVWTQMGDVDVLVLGRVACTCGWIACGHG